MDPLRRQLTDPTGQPLLEVMNLLRLLDREVPAQVVATFFYVATHDNCHKQALEEDLDMTPASASRNTDWLSKHHRLNKPGLDLIVKQKDPTNQRRITLSLTPKGRMLWKQLKEITNGN